ncbi:lysosomal alpha-mannosidase-like isoform X2 [Hydractinia symbiolongicarpus]|uniref:lysosomal alpha-mannosidase-like isoform X2 n=1 Tax=Hydractinia symbiolongicarpus TaxID=13093 RepID=UPI002550DD32|nr:lysosomal alpha-mannosidase-like isoform X2 [Hydractinia symbiolongicarpus]
MAARKTNRMFLLSLLLLQLSFIFAFDCNSKDLKLQIHIVPHTHDDVGWLKTVDEYYYGANRTIQAGAVQYILDTAIVSLQQNPNRTFIYVEMAFFKRWWDEQEDSVKSAVKKLLANKQLEFINGGWCMNDEAAAHYNAIIDQMTLGLRFIEDTFGADARPTVAWHIDPFGHSAEQASLFSLMSFDGFFFGRIDEADKIKRLKEQRMEMIWRGSRNYETKSQIFTGVTYNVYAPPRGFCFDDNCHDPPIQDNDRLFDNNVEERVQAFVDITCQQASSYKTNHIMLTMGEDFQYENAHRWFKNLDKLIHYVNKDGRVNVFYSTPSRYLKALHDAGKDWEVKTDDFFPYAHCPHCYWTGYFTSRPTQKGYIRESNNLLQACKQLEVLYTGKVSSSSTLRRAMAVNQHHDAVTGTEKQHVAYDYAKRLYIGREECKKLMSDVIKVKTGSTMQFKYCDFLNISVCSVSEATEPFAVNVYNPIARPIETYIRIPVTTKNLLVLGLKGQPIKSQIVSLSRKGHKLRRHFKGQAMFELVFHVCAPALGFNTYFVKHTIAKKYAEFLPRLSHIAILKTEYDFIENNLLRLEFSLETGRLVRMIRKDRKLSLSVDQQFFWYNGNTGDEESRQTSGAYIFRPNNTEPYEVCDLNKAKVQIIKGPLVEEVRQTFGPFISQVIRLYRNVPYAEFEHTVGPIPIKDGLGKEIITRFDTNIESGGLFYTDANGREMKERKRDYRATWKLNITEPVSENYYPINSRIYIKDSSAQLTVMSDRSQGGSSIRDGQIEIMLHRRLLVDDFLGVGEPLNEPGIDGRGLITRGKHRVLLTTPDEAGHLHRQQGELMLLQPILSFASNVSFDIKSLSKLIPTYSGLSRSLPENVHLLTMETIKSDEMILRFEHFYEKDEDHKLSNPVNFQLDGLFTDFNIVNITETNLSANQLLKDKKMMKWNTDEEVAENSFDGFNIELNPMQIRTFIAKFKHV